MTWFYLDWEAGSEVSPAGVVGRNLLLSTFSYYFTFPLLLFPFSSRKLSLTSPPIPSSPIFPFYLSLATSLLLSTLFPFTASSTIVSLPPHDSPLFKQFPSPTPPSSPPLHNLRKPLLLSHNPFTTTRTSPPTPSTTFLFPHHPLLFLSPDRLFLFPPHNPPHLSSPTTNPTTLFFSPHNPFSPLSQPLNPLPPPTTPQSPSPPPTIPPFPRKPLSSLPQPPKTPPLPVQQPHPSQPLLSSTPLLYSSQQPHTHKPVLSLSHKPLLSPSYPQQTLPSLPQPTTPLSSTTPHKPFSPPPNTPTPPPTTPTTLPTTPFLSPSHIPHNPFLPPPTTPQTPPPFLSPSHTPSPPPTNPATPQPDANDRDTSPAAPSRIPEVIQIS
ncbi:hypothetical protein C7M84_022315 [Penaeus vannamei]|uniref:Uncharacterized protein n=1 Tax=Penaeus vannamei TaxID=6689 RepID=A0A3R7PF08_PENVA|nr:hypothetical protein C7M84_022315 [Penaeus vannamei]